MAMASLPAQKRQSAITLAQLADHGTLDSLWIAVHGRVYDLTTFSSDHPGGLEVLENNAGADGTEAYEYAGHSAENMDRMEQYCVGRLERSHEKAFVPSTPSGTVKFVKSSASSGHQQSLTPRTRQAVTIMATCLLVVAFTHRVVPSILGMSRLGKSTTVSSRGLGYAFWAGMAVASLASLVAFRYLYLLFMASLDYQNDVFSFPPTMPRRTRRQNRY